MRMRTLGAATLAGLLSLGLAACGDDDGGGDETGLEDVDSGDAGDEGGDTTVDLGDVAGLSGECEVFAEAALAFGAAFGGAEGEDVDFNDLADAMEEFADEAPDEIRGDIEVLAEAYARFAAEFGDLDFNDPNAFTDPEVQARLAEAGEIFSSAEVTEASENLSAYTEANCSVEE